MLDVDREEGLGAVELCLAARAFGDAPRVDAVPRQRGAALRVEPFAGDLPAAFADLGDDSVAIALLEPGRGWSPEGASTALGLAGLDGRKVAVEHAGEVDRFAVVASAGGAPALALVAAAAGGDRGRAAALARPERPAPRRHVRRRRAPTASPKASSRPRCSPG